MPERVEGSVAEGENTIEERHVGAMWELEQKLDQPMDEEANKLKNMYREKVFTFSIQEFNSNGYSVSVGLSMLMLLRLSFQSLGIVYGDLGTSPLYVFYNTFPDGISDSEDVIGALSLIIYSLLLIPLIKYVIIVCKANDNGQGGTLAIYSLLCRHAKVKLIPNQQRSDEDLTTYSRTLLPEGSFAAKTKKWLESKESRKRALLFIVLLGTCMMIGDGILTPAISVLSATGGIKVISPKMSSDVVVLVSIIILIVLFSMQHYGTDKVGWLFAPIVFIWFLFIGATGMYNICKHDTSVLKAFSPTYIYLYFKRRGLDGWISLGGILLSITGTEALYADIAYFPLLAIQLAFTFFVFPCLLLAYCGQAAYLVNNKDHYKDAFYASMPGTAVVLVMLATTLLMILIMLLVWRCHWILVLIFAVLTLVPELSYFSAVIWKINQGGWVPLIIAAISLLVMSVWHYATVKKYEFEVHSKVSMSWILGLGPSLGLVRVPGIGLVYTELASGVPHIFSHFITNLPAIHSVVVFVCVKYLPVYTVPEEERFLVKRIGPKTFRMFRCVARYGYKDLHRKDDDFENKLLNNLFSFIRIETMMEPGSNSSTYSSAYSLNHTQESKDELIHNNNNHHNSNNNNIDEFSSMVDYTVSTLDTIVPADNRMSFSQNNTVEEEEDEEEDELQYLKTCKESGVVHIMGNTVVKARNGSWLPKKIAIDYVYAFLAKICRENSVILHVPHETLLNVGQVFYV
uniref:Potassium transporter n=1 Tax=Brassica campestris TaxID=3711 RepID=M4DWP6_BRACM